MAKKKTIPNTSAKKVVATTNKLEKIQDANLTDLKTEVAKIDSVEDIEELEKIEKRDDDRKGAKEILEKRKAELAGDEQPVRDPRSDEKPEYTNQKGEKIGPDDEVPMSKEELIAEGAIGESPYGVQGVKGNTGPIGDAGVLTESVDGPLEDYGTMSVREATPEEIAKWKAEADAKRKEKNKELVKRVKEERLALDKLLCKMQHHGRIDISPENSLFKAKAWLGVLAGQLGSDNPYKNEHKIQSRADIPATAEHDDSHHFKAVCVQFNNINTENAVIELRKELEKTIEFINTVETYDISWEASVARTQAYINATEARFHLGVILGSLKV